MTHLETVDTKELGEAIDMIKDLSEAIYYCTITEAMEKKDEEPQYQEPMYYTEPYYEDYERKRGRMYYEQRGGNGNHSGQGTSSASSGNNGNRYYTEREMPIMRDHREGRSPLSRKNYMESKEMHKDKASQMHELEKYVQELTQDLMEMVEDASPEEKQALSNKIATLATKIK